MNKPAESAKRFQTIYFIGSGPGDPELITVKGKRLLKKADVIVYAGSLVNEKVLQYARKDALVYNSASMTLDEIMKIMVKAAKSGKRVARLHTGDPTLYSALQEQAFVLEKYGIPYKVIPGVSSAFASACALKKELTLPEITQTAIFTRLEGNTIVPEKEKLSELSKHNATMCIFLSVGMIDKVVDELKKGYPDNTPAAVVYRATWEDEKIVRGRLKDIAKKVNRAGIKRQAMIIVGKTLNPSIPPLTKGGKGGLPPTSKLYDKGFEHGCRKKNNKY
ncbi:MAG: precorrin-4 C(11)-methyltransferase [Deltaproteobacteria bacterium]|nr:precorrin-4 C(11)-methyltransferase [Deltaproteobacteria bacterium]